MIASQELDRKQFFQPIVETVSRTLGLPASIWLTDETGEALRIAAATELPDEYIHEVFLRLDEPSVASDVFATGRAIVVTDIASDDRWKYKAEAAAMGLKSAMVVPLQVKNKIVGVLDVYTREARDFSDSEKALIESIATQVAITQRRIRDLAALNEVSLLINSELHLSELFRRVTLSATRVLDCQHVSVFLADESGDLLLEATSAKGIARSRFAPGEGLAGWVAQSGQSALVPDAVNDPRFVPGLSSDIAERSMLLVPITTVSEEVIGVISADKDGLDGFDEHDQSLLETLASQAAVAVRNARLFERETSRSTVLQRLHQIGEQLLSAELSARGLRRVLRQVAQSARSVLGADLVDVYQYIEAENRYIIPPILEGKRRDPTVVKEHIFEDDIAVRVVGGGEPLYTPDAQGDRLLSGPFTVERPERPEKRFVVREGVLSSAAMPLKAVGEAVGIMFVNYRTRQDFTPDQRAIIELFANQAALAIYNARVYEQATSRAAVLQRLHQIGGQLLSAELSARGLRRVLRQVAQSARSVLGADLVDVYQYIEAENRYIIPPTLAGKRRDPALPKDIFEDDVVARVVQGGEPRYSPDAQNDLLLTGPFTVERPGRPDRRFVVREGVLSSAAVPLKAAGETVGVMFVNYRTRRAFTPGQQEVIELFANQAATAIYNARAHEQIQARIKALEALNRVGQRLSTVEVTRRGLSRLLQQVARQAKRVLGADLVELYRYSPGREDVVAAHVSAGKKLVDVRPSTKILPDDVAAKVLNLETPLFAADAQHEPLLSVPFRTDRKGMPDQRFVARERIASTAAIPLMVGDEAVGILFVNYRTPQRFPAEQRELIQLFASQAAVAIRNAQLFQQRETLQHIARDITSVLDRDRLLQQTLERSLELLHCEFGSISVFDPRTNRLQFRYAVGKSPDMSVKLGEGLIGTAAETRRPVRVADVSQDDRYVCHVKETHSELDVPMLVGKRLIGVLNAESRRLNAFSEEDQHLAEALAAQAAVAFRTAELYGEAQARLQERVGDIRALQDIYALIGTAPLEGLLEQIAEEAARLTPAKYTGVWLLDERTRELRFGAMNRVGEELARTGPRLPLGKASISGHVALTSETYLCDDVRDDPYYQEWYEDVRSELTTPLVYGERVIGTLDLESTEVGAFTGDHVLLVEALARAAAAAIQSARLYRATQALNEVGQALTSGIRLREDEVLELIYKQAKELTGVQDMYIALYDEETGLIRFGLLTEHGERVHVEPRKANMQKRGRTEEVIFTRVPILHRTLAESKAWYGQPGHQEFIGRVSLSWMGVPMVAGEKVLGIIAMYDFEREYAYDEQDLQVVSSMASQAAIALDNATLYYEINRQLTRRVEALAALNEIGQMLTAGIRLKQDAILELIYEQARELTGTQDVYIALYDEGTGTIRFGPTTEHGERVHIEPREADMQKRGRTEEVIFTRRPVLHRTLTESKAWYGQPGHQEFIGRISLSWMGVPMVVGERVLGIIALWDWEREYAYDEQDLQVVSSMASQAAIALDNARLYEEARSEAIAARQLATLGTAIAALQHRINNTFNIIVPNVTRLRKRVDMADETIVEILDIIERNARYTSDIITRIQEPLREVEVQDVDVNAVLSDVVSTVGELWRADSTRPPVAVTLDLDSSIPRIRAPIGQVAEVLRNLVDNGYRAMKAGGQLTVTSQYAEGIIRVRVRDTGGGIPPAVQKRLFVKPVPSKEPGGGAGLGLWLSRLMLRSIGSDVTIEETCPTGTTMLVQIPAPGAGKGVRP